VRGERSKALPDSFRKTWSGTDLAIFESDVARGYFAFVRTPVTLVNDAKQARRLLRRISLPLFEVNVLPRLVRDPPPAPWWRWLGGNRVEYAAAAGDPPREAQLDELLREQVRSHENVPIRSKVLHERVSFNEYTAVVDASGGSERLLLKASFHPYWTAAVDGSDEPVDLVAPNLMAISVPPGRHEIRFRFRNPRYQKLLFAGSLAGALVYAGLCALRRR
jgi:hypothetical protein